MTGETAAIGREGRRYRRVRGADLEAAITALLEAASGDPEMARAIAPVFADADLRGMGTQGLDHVYDLVGELRAGRIDPKARPRVVKEGPAFAQVDGGGGPGQLGAVFCVELAARKAQEAGCCVAGLVNAGDIFAIGYFAELIAARGMVGLVCTDSDAFVHPYGGTERKIGTNPVAFACPWNERGPYLLDIATSIVSASHVRQAGYYEEEMPDGSGVDAEGRPTRVPAEIELGAIAPFGGHKGFALGLAVAILSGPMVGAEVMADNPNENKWPGKGHFFLAMNPEAFGPARTFQSRVGNYLQAIKTSRTADGAELRLPGERGHAVRARAAEVGIDMDEECLTRARALGETLGIELKL